MRSASLTIFEGPDGAGKSTAARRYAELTGARYVHFPALPQVGRGLGRMYVEAMLPALLGYQDVVFDRSWLSEAPYGKAYRGGTDRLGVASRRMLERLSMRCGAVVVFCDPGWDMVKHNYMGRRENEMLKSLDQLDSVYHAYKREETQLPWITYDYGAGDIDAYMMTSIDLMRMWQHPIGFNSAGNLEAEIVLVGESLTERKDYDPWYQWPFASFSNWSSQWLAMELEAGDIPERALVWLTSAADLEILPKRKHKIFALGEDAAADLYRNKIEATTVEHPQFWRRIERRETFPLVTQLRDLV